MKRILILLISFSLVSCFVEPKKEETELEKNQINESISSTNSNDFSDSIVTKENNEIQKTSGFNDSINVAEINKNDSTYRKTIYFDHSKAVLTKTALNELEFIVKFLNNKQYSKIEIHAHTDSQDDDINNMKLSKNRAFAIKNYLIEQGVADHKLILEWFGESQPINTNMTEFGKYQNNRADIKIKLNDLE